MGNEGYLKILDNSPVPCLWFSIIDDKIFGNKAKVIGYNKEFEYIIEDIDSDNIDVLKLDSNILTKLKTLKGNSNKIRSVEFVEVLKGFYELDIYKIEDNFYLLWITKQVGQSSGNIRTTDTCLDKQDKNKIKNQIISDYKILNLISDTIPDSIFVKDINGVFRHCNKVFAENRNLSKEQIIGKTEEEINTPNDKIERYKREEKEIKTFKSHVMTVNSFVDEDGKTKYYETVKVPMLDINMMVGGVVGISRDITHRKEAEFEYERLRMQFFSNISHEFKTPINIIFSSIQLIEYMIDKNEEASKFKTYASLIKQNGYRLLKMVNNLIDNTKFCAGCLEYYPQNYNIVEFVENICDTVRYYANEEGIELIFDTDVEEKTMAFDLEKMDRVMLNLLSNAIKYNKENGKIIVLLEFNDKELIIKVRDSGIGIPKEKLDEVFKLFKQVHNDTIKVKDSSGIGLSIVKSLVDIHSGSISVESESGIGSEFILRIPISLCDNDSYEKKSVKYNKYVENIDIEFSDIFSITK